MGKVFPEINKYSKRRILPSDRTCRWWPWRVPFAECVLTIGLGVRHVAGCLIDVADQTARII